MPFYRKSPLRTRSPHNEVNSGTCHLLLNMLKSTEFSDAHTRVHTGPHHCSNEYSQNHGPESVRPIGMCKGLAVCMEITLGISNEIEKTLNMMYTLN